MRICLAVSGITRKAGVPDKMSGQAGECGRRGFQAAGAGTPGGLARACFFVPALPDGRAAPPLCSR